MAKKLSELIDLSKQRVEENNITEGNRLAKQALVGAEIARDEFFQRFETRSTPVAGDIAELAGWFGDLAFIFNQATTVFDKSWIPEEHQRVSKILWDSLVFKEDEHVVRENYKKLGKFLQDLDKLASFAERLKRWPLAIWISSDIQRVHEFLFSSYRLGPEKFKLILTSCMGIRRSARCGLRMGNHDMVRKTCHLILTDFTDYNDAEAFGLWGHSLFATREFEVAAEKCEQAVKYSKTKAERQHYQRFLTTIRSAASVQSQEKHIGEESQDTEDGTEVLNRNISASQVQDTKDLNENFSSNNGGTLNRSSHHDSTEILYERSPESSQGSSDFAETEHLNQEIATLPNGEDESSGGYNQFDISFEGSHDNVSIGEVEDDSDEGNSTSQQGASEYYRSLAAVDSTETTFYEQSCRQYYTEDDNEETESNKTGLLRTGLSLSEAFLFQFEDKHPSVRNREPFYPAMLDEITLKDYLRRQPDKFKRGILQIESSHMSKCLPIEATDNASAIEISGRSKANQAFCEDEVVVELLDDERDKNDQRFGRVIGVLKRNRHRDVEHPVFICTLDDMESHLVRPMCKTVPKIHILNQTIKEKYKNEKRYKIEFYKYDEHCGTLKAERNSVRDINPGDREKYVFLVVFIKWSQQHVYPIGAIIDILPSGNTIENGLTILNLQHQIPALYSKETVQRVESIRKRQKDEPSPAELQGRKDLTSLTTFTIDPPGSGDIDDALSIEKDGENFKVGVHIADVSAHVKHNDQVDQEARERATTFYPGVRRPRHMLPEPLSTNICSLLPNKKRLTISVFMYLNRDGKPVQMEGPNFNVNLSYIKSCQQFTYTEAQRIIEDDQSNQPCSKDIQMLFKLARAIRKQRLGNAMFALDVEEEDEIEEQALEAHYMVEEFMIMANRKVAQVLTRKFPNCTPLRCQQPPAKEEIEAFTRKHDVFINALVCLQDRDIGGYLRPNLDTLIQTGTQEIIVSNNAWTRISAGGDSASKYIKTDAIHPLQYLAHSRWMSIQEHATYRCSGSLKGSKDGSHYSLDIYPYSHFTSPIRRYCDLMVHRLLKALLTGKSAPYGKEEMENICAHMNARMARAKEYQKGCKVLQQAIELKVSQRMVSCFVDDVSDRGISFRAPTLQNISQRELPFSLLGVCFKPQLATATDSAFDRVTTTWIMRLYNLSRESNNKPDGGRTLVVNPYQDMSFLPLAIWGRILKSCIDERKIDLQRYLKRVQVLHKTEGQLDVTTECEKEELMQPNTRFSISFTHGQIIKVQMTSVPRKGILTPCPMLYTMTDNVKFCLMHRDDPVFYLSHYTTNPTFKSYKSIKIYLERWLPLIEMEAAIGAVQNDESCIINHVNIKFKSATTGKFVLSSTDCETRNIEFSGTETEGDVVSDPGSSYDWLCLRCNLKHTSSPERQRLKSVLEHSVMWLGHAKITSVKKQSPNLEVAFELHDQSPPLPVHARFNTVFQVEILRKSEVDRRTESFIKKLPSMPDSLVEKIALKNSKHCIEPLDMSRSEIASVIEPDIYILPGENVKYPLPRNNIKQQMAIDKALVSRFTLIQGPPGTGKTYTGIKLTVLFDRINRSLAKEKGIRKQVLFCGPSNKSVDLVARWMKNRLGENMRPKFVRVYGRSIEAIDFPIPGRNFLTKKSTRNQKADDDLKEVAVHHLIRKEGKDGNRYAKEINEIDKIFKDSDYAPQPPGLISKYVHLVREATIEEIRKYDVILCTTAVGSNPKILEACSVYQVIVDEAGMCPEPQCLVPIIATQAEQVVLIGDHKQLRPVIMSKQAAELGLDQSLFERYVSEENETFTMLVQQYRMHPEICKFPSSQFYKGKLITERGRWYDPVRQYIWQTRDSFPHVLVNVEGEENVLTVSTEDGNEQSKSNSIEVEHVVKVFRYLINEGIPDSEINVMSQYNAQCAEIKRALEEANYVNYQVSTVVSSQGGEWDYVIFSTVRSMPDYKIEKSPTLGWCKQNLGFITDENQINVALTRARKGLIIIGNQKLLNCDDVWKKLIKRYSDNGCIKTTDQFPPRERSRQEKMQDAQRQSYRRYGDEMFIPGAATSYTGPVDQQQTKTIGQRYNFKHRTQRNHNRKN